MTYNLSAERLTRWAPASYGVEKPPQVPALSAQVTVEVVTRTMCWGLDVLGDRETYVAAVQCVLLCVPSIIYIRRNKP